MSYYLDDHAMDLEALQNRLQSTDLIPSQTPLMDGLAGKIKSLTKAGITSVANLRSVLKSEKSLGSLGETSGVDADYLRLLKRVINGFFPKPRPLKDLDWLDAGAIKTMHDAGLKNTRQLYEAGFAGAADMARQTGIEREVAQQVLAISDLCRIQWVSPSFARALIATGVTNAATVAAANPDELCAAIKHANQNATFYKGTIGLRDIKRLWPLQNTFPKATALAPSHSDGGAYFANTSAPVMVSVLSDNV